MISLQDLETELQEHLGLDDSDLVGSWTMDKIDLLLNRAFWEIIDKFPFREKEVSATFPTVQGASNYAIPAPFEALRQLSIEDVTTFAHTPLIRITPWEYERKLVNDPSGDFQDKPVYYIREAAGIKLLPVPDQAYTITIKYNITLSDLSSVNPTVVIPQVWHEIILLGGVYRGFLRLGDYARAQAAQAHQARILNTIQPVEEKEEKDSHIAGLDVLYDGPGNPNFPRYDAFGYPLRPNTEAT